MNIMHFPAGYSLYIHHLKFSHIRLQRVVSQVRQEAPAEHQRSARDQVGVNLVGSLESRVT